MTEVDVFRDKLLKALPPLSPLPARVDNLSRVPLERHFPDHTGGSDIDEATSYILGQFRASQPRTT